MGRGIVMSDQNYRRGDVSTINWFGTLFLASIPVVNIVFFIIWALSATNEIDAPINS